MESEITNKKHPTKLQTIVTFSILSILIILFLYLIGIDFNGKINNWAVIDVQTDTYSKIGFIENSEHRNDKTRIIGSYGSPLGIFDEVIYDPTWEFKDRTTFTLTEITTTPTKCTNSITGDNFSFFDRDYKKCMSSHVEQIFKAVK